MKLGIGMAIGNFAILGLLAFGSAPASAITAELAKTCREQALKAYPAAPAGSRSTNAEQQRESFRMCLEQASNDAAKSSIQQSGSSQPASGQKQ